MQKSVITDNLPLNPANPRTVERADFAVTGMTCAACARRIEKRLSKGEGVISANVNFAGASATVEFESAKTSQKNFAEALNEIGFGAIFQTETETDEDFENEVKTEQEKEFTHLFRRFWFSLIFTLPVFALAMAHEAIHFVINPQTSAFIQFVLTTPVIFYAGAKFFVLAWKAARSFAADMNTLIAVGTGAAYFYSVFALFSPEFFGKHAGHHTIAVYFESAAVIITLVLLGRLLESRAKKRANSAIEALLNLQAKTARVIRGENEIEI